jgi:lipopolysaccharide transport system permease protein
MIVRDLKVRYRQAALGAAWVVLQPLFAALIFWAVFGFFARLPSDGVPYPLFALCALLPWTYFAESVRRAATGLVSESDLVRKVYFPRLVVPLAGVIAPLVDLVIGFTAFLVVAPFFGIFPSWQVVAVIPLALQAMLLALAVGLWLGPINVRYRDVMHTLPFMLQLWMYASPIVYPVSMVPERWQPLYALNPMVGIIEGFRWAALGTGATHLSSILVSLIVICVLLFLGLVQFKRTERIFADII